MYGNDFGMWDYGSFNDYSSVGSNIGANIGATIVVIYLLVIGVMFIGMIVDYLLRGFGMYKMGKAQGRTNSWLAFVPFARTYFQGELSGEIRLKNKSVKNPGIWLVVIPIIANVVFAVMYFIFMMVTMLGALGSVSRGQGSYGYENAVMGVVSGLIIFLIFVVIFAVIYQAFIMVMYVLVNHQIYGKYTTKNMAIAHAVLGTLIPLYQSICMFIFGRRAEQESERMQEMPGESSSFEKPEDKNE